MFVSNDDFEDIPDSSDYTFQTSKTNRDDSQLRADTDHLNDLRKKKLEAQREKMKQRLAKRHSKTNSVLAPTSPLGTVPKYQPKNQPSSSFGNSAKKQQHVVSPSPNKRSKGDGNMTGLSAKFDPGMEPKREEAVDMNDPLAFLQTPLPSGLTLQCYINRYKEGVRKLYPKYELYLKENDEFLLAAKKRPHNKTSNYIISMEKDEVEKDSSGYLGKLRSNFVGTEFVLYDNGLNPKTHRGAVQKSIRKELAGVIYQSNILGSRGPRKMHVLVPTPTEDSPKVFQPPYSPGVIKSFQEGNLNELMVMANRAPKWNEQVGAYVLNFNGRVTMASVKNFQLIFEDNEDHVLLQFGRVDKDKFTMDFKHPLTPLQAFAICLSSFDYKLACE